MKWINHQTLQFSTFQWIFFTDHFKFFPWLLLSNYVHATHSINVRVVSLHTVLVTVLQVLIYFLLHRDIDEPDWNEKPIKNPPDWVLKGFFLNPDRCYVVRIISMLIYWHRVKWLHIQSSDVFMYNWYLLTVVFVQTRVNCSHNHQSLWKAPNWTVS